MKYKTYSPNYALDNTTREDILGTIANSTDEWYRIDDIVRNIEGTAKKCIQNDLTCHIPFLGTFKHNFKRCYTENKDKILAAKQVLDPVEYINFKRLILRTAVAEEIEKRRYKAILPAEINKNKDWYKYLLTKFPKWQADGFMVLFPDNFTPPIGYNIDNEKV
jgi:hypothetical protein